MEKKNSLVFTIVISRPPGEPLPEIGELPKEDEDEDVLKLNECVEKCRGKDDFKECLWHCVEEKMQEFLERLAKRFAHIFRTEVTVYTGPVQRVSIPHDE